MSARPPAVLVLRSAQRRSQRRRGPQQQRWRHEACQPPGSNAISNRAKGDERPRPPGRKHFASLRAITARRLQALVGQRLSELFAALVLEGNLNLHPVALDLAVFQLHVELRDLGCTEVAERLR